MFGKKKEDKDDEMSPFESFIMNTIGDKAIPYAIKFVNKITPTFSEKGIILIFTTTGQKQSDGTKKEIPILILIDKEKQKLPKMNSTKMFNPDAIIETVDLTDKENFQDFVNRAQTGKIECRKIIDLK